MALLSKDDLLEVWRRSLDANYVSSVEAAGYGNGLEIYEAHAEMLARASLAVERSTQGMFILPHSGQTEEPARGEARSTCVLTIERDRLFHIPLVFGTSVQVTDAVGRKFALVVEASLAAGDPGPVLVSAVAVRPGWGYDVREGTLDEFVQPGSDFANQNATVALPLGVEELTDTGRPDVLLPGHVGQYVQFTAGVNVGAIRRVASWRHNADGTNTVVLTDDAAGAALAAEAGTAGWRVLRWGADLGVSVTNDAADGGRLGMLDMLGRERRIVRRDGESDDAYRLRVATLPDTISPNAIRRAGNRILAPLGEKVVLREVGYPGLPGLFWDLDAFDYDDVVRPADRFKLWLDTIEMRGFFLVGVPNRTDGEFGFFYDEGFVDAYDSSPADSFYDGFPAVYWLQYVAPLYDQINAIKGGGVGFDIYRVQPDDPPE